MAFTEVIRGVTSAARMAEIQENGEFLFETDGYVDAKAVFDAVKAETVKVTHDKKMYIHTLSARELLDKRQVRRQSWIDTLDMAGDGLTKGSVDREALIELGLSNRWRFSGMQSIVYKAARTTD